MVKLKGMCPDKMIPDEFMEETMNIIKDSK
jgi:hypothetical protein